MTDATICKGNNTKSYNHRHTHVTSFKQFQLIGVSTKNAQFPMSHPIAKTDVLTKNSLQNCIDQL